MSAPLITPPVRKAASCLKLSIDDIDLLCDVVSGANLEFRQLSAGRLIARFSRTQFHQVRIESCFYSHPLRATGRASESSVIFSLVTAPVLFNGIALDAGDVALFPPGTEFDGFSKGPLGNHVFTISPDNLMCFAEQRNLDVDLDRFCGFTPLDCPNHEKTMLASLATKCGDTECEFEARELAERILSRLCRLLVPRERTSAARSQFARQSRLIGHAEQLLSTHQDEELTVADLSQALDVSVRTLQAAFRSVVGLGPCEYGRILRLHAARRELMSRWHHQQVSAIALRHGFSHLGRFSTYYHEFFGETPSSTYRRSIASLRNS